jgi:DegV family protein with EDD domain
MRIAIVTDSTSDLPAELTLSYGIQVVPNILVMDGQEYEDGKEITREAFYDLLPGMRELPTTATASSGAYGAVYERLFSESSDSILSIHAPSTLSGIFNAASLAAQPFGERVRVIDSGQVSMGLGFQVLAAAEAVEAGLDAHDVLACLEYVRKRVRLIAMLDTLEYLRRSGRVSWARASLGSLLRIKPFIEVRDGAVRRLGEVRTRRKGFARLLERIREGGPYERLAILHTNAGDEARQLLEAASSQFTDTPFILNVTTVIGTHAGPGALGFAGVPR